MIVTFSTKDAQVPQPILDKMDSKLHHRLDKYFKDEAEDETVLHVKIVESKQIHKVEITLPFATYQLRSETSDKTGPMPALDKGMDILERQIHKAKTKLTKRRTAGSGEDDVFEPPVLDESETESLLTEYRVVKSKSYEMKPMSLQEAILHMDLLGHNFYMFLNIDTGYYSTVYRRNDGDFGLIEPDEAVQG